MGNSELTETGDFLDDCVCVHDNGDIRVALNAGLDSNGIIIFHDPGFSTPAHSGYQGRHVRLG